MQLSIGNNKPDIAVEDDGKVNDVNAAAISKGAGMEHVKYRVQYFMIQQLRLHRQVMVLR